MIGQTVSHYKIIEKLGEGGMGVVYKALDTTLERHVAIKFLPPHLKSDEQAKKRFVREAKSASALNHANIAVVHEINESPEGQMFIVMAYYEGQTIKDKLVSGALGVDEAIAVTSQIASAISTAHEKGILHRDIKPANILIGADGQAKLADFGLAKLAGQTGITKTGTTVGTVAYMSPEQASGGEVDHRSDIFSLGVVLYELLTGRLPFRGDHEAAVLYGIMNTDPEPVDARVSHVPPGLQQVVDRALSKSPSLRYQTVAEMRADIESIRSGGEVGSQVARRNRSSVRRLFTIGLVVAIAAVTAYVALQQLRPSGETEATADNNPQATIAVLPFVNASSDSEQEYFSDGLTEELMNALVKIPEIRVTGRASSFFFKNKNEDLRVIGQRLGVSNILEGSVRRAGDKIKISAQLTEASSGFQIWSDIYEQPLGDILAVQTSITRSVAVALGVTPPEEKVSEVNPSDAVVRDLVLRARYVLASDRTAAGAERAQQFLNRALATNPDYARAWVEMFTLYLRKAGTTENLTLAERDSLRNAQRQALDRALALNPELAEAHAKRGIVHLWDLDFEAAIRSAERAMELDPRNPAVTNATRPVYGYLGRVDKSVSLSKQAVESDPLALSYRANLAEAYITAGRFEDALTACDEALELRPSFWVAHSIRGKAYVYQGRVEEARESWKRWREHLPESDDFHLWSTAIIEHSAGNSSAADSALSEYEERYGEEEPVSCAAIRAWRGETDEAFNWLEKAYAVRHSDLSGLKVTGYLRSLHGDPRWNELLERIGFPMD